MATRRRFLPPALRYAALRRRILSPITPPISPPKGVEWAGAPLGATHLLHSAPLRVEIPRGEHLSLMFERRRCRSRSDSLGKPLSLPLSFSSLRSPSTSRRLRNSPGEGLLSPALSRGSDMLAPLPFGKDSLEVSRLRVKASRSLHPSLLRSCSADERCWAWFLGVAVPAGLPAGALEGNQIPLQEYDSALISGPRSAPPTPFIPPRASNLGHRYRTCLLAAAQLTRQSSAIRMLQYCWA